MWGCASDLAAVQAVIQRSTNPRRVLVLNADVNAARLTYDGLDVCGDRLAALVGAGGCGRL